MTPEERLETLIHQSQVGTGSQADQRILADALDRMEKLDRQGFARTARNLGRIIMKSPVTKLAVAAAVLIACGVGLSLWSTTGSRIALADVLARVEKAKAVKYKWTFKFFIGDPNEGSTNTHGTALTSQEYGSKMIFQKPDSNGGERTESEHYSSGQNKPVIWISRTEKTYVRFAPGEKQAQAQQEQSQRQIAHVKDPLSYLKEILNTKYESMGRSTMDGIEVVGFRTTDPNQGGLGRLGKYKEPQADVKTWVDVKTLLPVRIESFASALGPGGGRMFMSAVTYDFQWDIPVDASEFEAPPIPDGYAITDIFSESATEENAISSLKECVELLGNYPASIDLTYLWSECEKSETPAALRLREELKGLTGLERDNKKMDALKPVRFLDKFYRGLAGKLYRGMPSKDPAYYGDKVTPKDADKVLLRWRIWDEQYRVIYGDLHAETVSAEKLAEMGAPLPKVNAPGSEGGFESGVLGPWQTYGNVTTHVVTELAGATVPEKVIKGKYCLFLDVAPGIANFWDAGLQYRGVVFQKGKKYTLSAFLKSKKGPMQVYFKPELEIDPWTGYGDEMMTITEKWAEYSVTTPVFEADVRPASLTFHIGSAVGGLWIDGVRFYEGDYVPPPAGQ
jgi:hypothetical protein